MSKKLYSILSLFLIFVMLVSSVPVSVYAAEEGVTYDEINADEVYLKQKTSITCTLASAAMLMRRTAIIAGYEDWQDITEEAIRSTAWVSGVGLRWNFDYRDIHIGHGYYPGDKHKEFMLELLDLFPHGVVVYNTGNDGQNHAVFLCDYDEETDTFYVADPASGVPEGRITLEESSIAGDDQDEKIKNLAAYWYTTSPVVTKENGVFTAEMGVFSDFVPDNSGDHSQQYDPESDIACFDETKQAVHKYFVVNTDASGGAALRQYPSGSSDETGYVHKGEILFITYKGENDFGAEWYKTNTGSYIFESNLVPYSEYSEEIVKFSNTKTQSEGSYKASSVASDSIALRLEPAEGNNIVGYADNGSMLYITHKGVNSVGASWLLTQEGYYVKSSEMEFVSDSKLSDTDYSGSYLLVTGEYSCTPIEDQQGSHEIEPTEYIITASALNLRETAVDGEVLISIPKDTVVVVTSIVSGWGKTTYKGHEGWITLEYAELYDENQQLEPLEITSVTLSSSVVHTGETVSCSVTVNSDKSCMYRFTVFDENGEILSGGTTYGTKDKYDYVTEKSGSIYFSAEVLCRDERTASAFSGNVRVSDRLQINSVTSDVEEYVYVGSQITWTASAEETTSSAVYYYRLYCGSELMFDGESMHPEFKYTPEKAGDYRLCVYLSDGYVSSEEISSGDVCVYDELTISSIDVTPEKPSAGQGAVCTITAKGGTGIYQYCFTVFKDGVIIKNGAFISDSSSELFFEEDGIYKVFCAVKDSGNMIISAFSADIEVSDKLMGDVDSDGKVTAMDSRTVLRHSAGLELLDASVQSVADVNNDGKVNASDARLILRCAAKLEIF